MKLYEKLSETHIDLLAQHILRTLLDEILMVQLICEGLELEVSRGIRTLEGGERVMALLEYPYQCFRQLCCPRSMLKTHWRELPCC